jgi:hypothetical protein
LGSGRPRGPEALARTERVSIQLRPGEKTDLEQIAEAWCVPMGTAAWGIVSERLAEWREKATEFGPSGLAIIAGLELLGYSQAVIRAAREIVSGRGREA